MNFTTVEGQYSRLSEENYDDFKQDYLHSELTTHQVREKWRLSKKEYSSLTKKIREELGIKCRPSTIAKNFYKIGNNWHILKTIDHQTIFYGSLSCKIYSEKDLVGIVKRLKEWNWNYELCRAYLSELEEKQWK